MDEMIPLLSFPDLSHEQIRTLTCRFHDLITSEKTAHPMLKELVDDAKAVLAIHEMVLNRPVGSDLTEGTQGTDGMRDKAIKNFMDKVYVAANDFNEEVSTFAASVKKVCEDHGGKGITKLKLAEQTDRTRRLLSILKTPDLMAKVENLGFAKDLLFIEQFNNEFETLWKQRLTENPEARSMPPMKEVRDELNTTHSLFVRTFRWLSKKGKTGLQEASVQAIRKLFVELSADLKAQATVKATADAKSKAVESGATN